MSFLLFADKFYTLQRMPAAILFPQPESAAGSTQSRYKTRKRTRTQVCNGEVTPRLGKALRLASKSASVF